MRTTLFVSALFAVSLVGGVALAEKPPVPAAKEPKHVIDKLRAHGEVADKSYRVADKGASKGPEAGVQVRQSKSHVDKAANRVNCSDTGADCPAAKGASRASNLEASQGSTGRAIRAPAFLDKIMGSDRMACNEADECMMSNRAVKRAWSHGGSNHAAANKGGSSGAVGSLSKQQQHERKGEQASEDRMVCNEADECMMSSKAAKKDWSYAAVKAGTWTGPGGKPMSDAARAVAQQRRAAEKAAVKETRAGVEANKNEIEHQH
jgi:hypothetical protein